MTVILSWTTDGTLSLCGELDSADVPHLEKDLARIIPISEGGLQLDLLQLELMDSGAVLEMHELLRRLAHPFRPLAILHAPQILAHSLYRVGDLERPDLYLVEPREEEPYG